MEVIKIPIPAQRQQKISQYLAEYQSATIKDIADLCCVSEATARRDLDDMAANGLLERTHGGAVVHRGTGFEEYHSEKMKLMVPEKTRIASAAAKILKDGDSIILDSGTTTYLLAEQLKDLRHISVITNNLDIAYFCKLDTSSTMIVTGGIRREGYSILIGEPVQEMLHNLCVDYAFLGADSVDVSKGIFCSNFIEVGVKRSEIRAGKKVVLLADSSKFQKKSMAKLCGLSEVDIIITDSGVPEDQIELLREQVGQVIVC